jgi:hypothetical protein
MTTKIRITNEGALDKNTLFKEKVRTSFNDIVYVRDSE